MLTDALTGEMEDAVGSATEDLTGGGKLPAVEPTDQHHVFPQAYADEFGQVFQGTGESIHDYTLELPRSLHQDIHAQGWNADWEEFLYSRDSLPSAGQAKGFATQMIHDYGLENYPMRPYRFIKP